MVDLFLLSQAQMRRILRGINSSEKLRRPRLFFSGISIFYCLVSAVGIEPTTL